MSRLPTMPGNVRPGLGSVLSGIFGGMPAAAGGIAPPPMPTRRLNNASSAAGGIAPPPASDLPERGKSPFDVIGSEPMRVDVAPLQINAPPPPEPNKLGRGQLIAGILADMLAGATGREAQFAPMMLRRQEQEAARQSEEVRWQRDRDAKREDLMMPRVEEVGGAVGMLDPQRQRFDPFYSTPQPFERYAAAQGFQPGSPEYARAVEDYRLGSWSDPAMENRLELEGERGQHRSALQAERQAAQLRQLNARLGVQRRGQDVASRDRAAARDQRGDLAGQQDRRIRDSAGFKGTPRKASPASNSARMINPKTGQAIILKGGKWVDEKTGRPVS